MPDRAIFNEVETYSDPALLLCPGQNVAKDKGSTGEGTHVVFPFRSKKESIWKHRPHWKKCI